MYRPGTYISTAFANNPWVRTFLVRLELLRALNQVLVVSRTSPEVAYTRHLNAYAEGD